MIAGQLEIQLFADIARIKSDMAAVNGTVGSAMAHVERTVAATKQVLGGLFAGASVGAAIAWTRSIINGIDALNDLKDATGASIENISALEDVARRTGTTFDTVASSLVKFNKVLAEAKPGSGAEAVLKAVNISAKEMRDLDPADALHKTAQALAGFADDGNKARVIQELFGKSVKEAAPFLKDLAEQGALNAKVTTAQAEEAEKFNKQLFEMKKASEDVSREIVSNLLPTMNKLLQNFRGIRELGGLGLVIKDAARDLIGITPVMTGDNGADINQQIRERTRLMKDLDFARRKGLATRDLEGAIEEKNAYLEILRLKQRNAVMADAGEAQDALSRRLASSRPSVGALPDVAAAAAASKALEKELEKQAKLIAELNGLSGSFADDWDRLNAIFASGKISLEQLTQAQADLLAKQPAIKKETEDRIKLAKQEEEVAEQARKETQAALDADYDARTRMAVAITAQSKALSEAEQMMRLEEKLIGATDRERSLAIENLKIEVDLQNKLAELRDSLAFRPEEREMERQRLEGLAQRSRVLAEQRSALEEHQRIWSSIDQTAHDVFVNIFEGGSNVFKKLGQTLKAALLDWLYQMTVKKWLINIGANFQGTDMLGGLANLFGGGGGGGGSAGGPLSMLSQGSSMYSAYNTVAGWFGKGAATGAATGAGATGVMAGDAAWAAVLEGEAASSVAAGANGMMGALNSAMATIAPFIPFIAVAIKMINDSKGETRSGGQYGFAIGGNATSNRRGTQYSGLEDGAFWMEGPSGGDPYQKEATGAMNATVTGINSLFEGMGSKMRVTGFGAGYESSQAGKGGVYAGGTLTGGLAFGEAGTGDNYDQLRNPLFEKTSNNSPNAQEAFTNFGTDLMQSSIQAMQAASGILSPSQIQQRKSLGFFDLPIEGSENSPHGMIQYGEQEVFGDLVHAARTAAEQAAIEAASGIPQVIRDMIRDIDPESLTTEAATALNAAISKTVMDVASLTSALKNLGFDAVAAQSFDVKHALIELSGGLDALGANLGNYYTNFYTEEEQRARLVKNLTASFASLNLPMIDLSKGGDAVRKAFRALVEEQEKNLGTESGQKAYAGLLALSGAVAELTPMADSAASAVESLTDALGDAFDALKRAVDAQKKQLELQRGISQEQLNAATAVYNTAHGAAGDLYGASPAAAMRAASGRAFVANAASAARSSGYLPDAAQFSDAVGAARSGLGSENFRTAFEQTRATLRLAGQLSQIEGVAGVQKTLAEQQLDAIREQIDQYDTMLEQQQTLIDAANGIDTSVLSVAEALQKLTDLLAPKKAATASAAATSAGFTTGGRPDVQYGGVPGTVGNDKSWFYEAGAKFDWLQDAMGWYHRSDEIDPETGLLKYPNGMPSFAVGTDYVPQDMVAQIHQGERITPAQYNRSDATNAQLVQEIRILGGRLERIEKNTKAVADRNLFTSPDGDAVQVRVVT